MDLAIWLVLVGRILGADVADPAHGGPLGPRSAVAVAAGGAILAAATVGIVAYGIYAQRGRVEASMGAVGLGPRKKPEMPLPTPREPVPLPSAALEPESVPALEPAVEEGQEPGAPMTAPALESPPGTAPGDGPPPSDTPLPGDGVDAPVVR